MSGITPTLVSARLIVSCISPDEMWSSRTAFETVPHNMNLFEMVSLARKMASERTDFLQYPLRRIKHLPWVRRWIAVDHLRVAVATGSWKRGIDSAYGRLCDGLHPDDLLSLRAFRSLNDIEFDFIAFVEGLESVRLYCGKVAKYVGTVCAPRTRILLRYWTI
jgi:hypothetical protein